MRTAWPTTGQPVEHPAELDRCGNRERPKDEPRSTPGRRTGRELPGRGVPGLRVQQGVRIPGPGVVPAPEVDEDQGRCTVAGVPQEVAFATKPALATQLIQSAVAAGVPCAWVARDEVYGADPQLRAAVGAAGVGFVLAVARTHRVHTALGPRRAVDLASRPDLPWNRLPAGHGTKGPRLSTGHWSTSTTRPWPTPRTNIRGC